jgi:hypothetical protein
MHLGEPHAFNPLPGTHFRQYISFFPFSLHHAIRIQKSKDFVNLLWTAGFIVVQTAVNRFGVIVRHLPEGVLDDDRRVAADADLQIQHMLPLMQAEIIGIGCGCPVPAFILHKGIIRP